MSSPEPPRPTSSRPVVSVRMRRLLWAGLAIAILGEGGHQLFDRYGTAIGHHAFHVGMVGAAAILFAAIIVLDIRRNGAPRFSWRLSSQPRQPPSTSRSHSR